MPETSSTSSSSIAISNLSSPIIAIASPIVTYVDGIMAFIECPDGFQLAVVNSGSAGLATCVQTQEALSGN
jgi:hypothetical protein